MKTASKKSRGVALIIVMAALFLMSTLALEIGAGTRVDLRISRNARDRLQAYYLAQSSVRLSLLRIYMYRELQNLVISGGAFASALPKDLIDKVWNVPFPAFPVDDKKSVWPGKMESVIRPEGSKIPINLLDGKEERGSSPEKAEQIKKQIIDLIKQRLEDEAFADRYKDLEAEPLVNALIDWIDADTAKIGGGEEADDYERQDPPVHPRNGRISSLSELHLVHGWTDDLVQEFGQHFSTVNSALTLNPNYVSIQRIKAIEPKLSEEDLKVIFLKRQQTAFADLNELANFIRTDVDIKGGKDFTFPTSLTSSNRETVFNVEGSGRVGEARRSLVLSVRLQEEIATKTDGGAPQSDGEKTGTGDAEKPDKPKKLIEPLIVSVGESL